MFLVNLDVVLNLQELHSDTLSVLSDLEGWCELDWAGLSDVQIRLPPVRERLRDMSHCLSDCWTTLDNTQRLLSTLTEVTQRREPSVTGICSKTRQESSAFCAGYPMVRHGVLHLLLLPALLFFHLSPGVAPSYSAVPFPGRPLLSHGAGRRSAPGSLDADGGALQANRRPGETAIPAVGPNPKSGPGEGQDSHRKQPVGPDGP